MSTNVILQAGNLTTTCFSTHQEEYEEYIRQTTATLPEDSVSYIISTTAPSADDRDKLWIQVDAQNRPIQQWIFTDSKWVWPHPVPISDLRREIFVGTAAQVDTLDGGVAGTAKTFSGPFWEIDTTMSLRFPLGVGTLESGETVSSGETGGQERVTLIENELPDHGHIGKAYYRANAADNSTDPSGEADNYYHQGTGHGTRTSGKFAAAGVRTESIDVSSGKFGNSHDNMPPYMGVYFIKRTIREFYTAS